MFVFALGDYDTCLRKIVEVQQYHIVVSKQAISVPAYLKVARN